MESTTEVIYQPEIDRRQKDSQILQTAIILEASTVLQYDTLS